MLTSDDGTGLSGFKVEAVPEDGGNPVEVETGSGGAFRIPLPVENKGVKKFNLRVKDAEGDVLHEAKTPVIARSNEAQRAKVRLSRREEFKKKLAATRAKK